MILPSRAVELAELWHPRKALILPGRHPGPKVQHLALIAPVWLHDKESPRSTTVGDKSDAIAIRRPGGQSVDSRAAGQLTDSAGGCHDVNVPIAGMV